MSLEMIICFYGNFSTLARQPAGPLGRKVETASTENWFTHHLSWIHFLQDADYSNICLPKLMPNNDIGVAAMQGLTFNSTKI